MHWITRWYTQWLQASIQKLFRVYPKGNIIVILYVGKASFSPYHIMPKPSSIKISLLLGSQDHQTETTMIRYGFTIISISPILSVSNLYVCKYFDDLHLTLQTEAKTVLGEGRIENFVFGKTLMGFPSWLLLGWVLLISSEVKWSEMKNLILLRNMCSIDQFFRRQVLPTYPVGYKF